MGDIPVLCKKPTDHMDTLVSGAEVTSDGCWIIDYYEGGGCHVWSRRLAEWETESQLHMSLENHAMNGEGLSICFTCIYWYFLCL